MAHRGLSFVLAGVIVVAGALTAAAACGIGVEANDISALAWSEDAFPRPIPPVYVEIGRSGERSASGPTYAAVRYTYSRPPHVDRAGDAAALYRAATRLVVESGFFGLDPRAGPLSLDAVYRTIAAERCGQIVQVAFFYGADARLNALFDRLMALTRGAAWTAAPDRTPPARLPILRLPNGTFDT